MAALPAGYRRFLVGVGLFGIGDFAHTLLILAAIDALAPAVGGRRSTSSGRGRSSASCCTPGGTSVRLLAAFPAGWLGDRVGHVRVLVGGYLVGAATMAGFAGLILSGSGSLVAWAVPVRAGRGVHGGPGALEPAIVPDLVPDRAVHGTAFGVLAVVNGLGDVVASLTVGGLFATAGPAAGLGYAAVAMAMGAAWMALRANPSRQRGGEALPPR